MKNTYRPKKTSWVIHFSFFFLLFSSLFSFSQSAEPDTAFVGDLVRFYQSRCGNILKGKLYTTFAPDSPHIYVFVAHRDKIENALKNVGYFVYCKHDIKKAQHLDSVYSNVNDCYIYSTSVNASTQLSSELFSYRKETQAFIVFHELTHVLISTMKSKLTYTVAEAVCDLVGNYLTREYAVAKKTLVLKTVDAQIMLNEHIYNILNSTIMRIEANAKQKDAANLFLSKELTRNLAKGDAYQKNRWDQPVNNAYLLKNSFCSQNYYDFKTKYIFNRALPKDLREVTN